MSTRRSRCSLFELFLGALLAVASESPAQVCPAASPAGPVQAELRWRDGIFMDGFESGNTADWTVTLP